MIDNDGLMLLCAAVIDKAREDYVTGTEREREAIRHFVRSHLFQVYTLGIPADPEDVISTWDRERMVWHAQRIRVCERMDAGTTEDKI